MLAIVINYNRCKKCGICVAFCPKGVFVADIKGCPEVKDVHKCTKCGLCVMRCPDFALEVRD